MFHTLRDRSKPGRVPALVLLLLGQAAPVVAQSPGGERVPSASELEERVAALEQLDESPDGVRQRAIEIYRLALSRLRTAEDYRAQAEAYRSTARGAPGELAELEQSLGELRERNRGPPELPHDAGLSELERELDDAEAAQRSAQSRLQALTERIDEQRARLAGARAELAEIEAQPPRPEQSDVDSAEVPEPLQHARESAAAAERRMQAAQRAMLEAELASYDARLELLETRQAVAREELFAARTRATALRELVEARRRAEIAKITERTERAEAEVAGSHPAVREAAAVNADLSRQLSELTRRITQVERERESVQQRLSELDRDLQAVQEQLAISGLSQSLGEVLREQRAELPARGGYRRDAGPRRTAIAESRLQQFRLSQRRERLRDPRARAQAELAADIEAQTLDTGAKDLVGALADILRTRQQLLKRLVERHREHAHALVELDELQRQLLDKAERLRALLDERLLWIPSGPPVTAQWLSELLTSVQWLSEPGHWRVAGAAAVAGARAAPWLVAVALIGLTVLPLVARRCQARRMYIGEFVGNVTHDSYWWTAEALLLDALRALPLAVVLSAVGLMLLVGADEGSFAKALGRALAEASGVWLGLRFVQRMVEEHGAADRHFGWRHHARRILGANLRWLAPVFLVCACLVQLTHWSAGEAHRHTLGRVGLVVSMLALAAFFWRVVHPRQGAVAGYLQRVGDTWLCRLRYLWFAVAVSAPLGLAGLALSGYYFTAYNMGVWVLSTLALMLGGIVLHGLILRLIMVTERRVALGNARARRRAQLAAREAREELEIGVEGTVENIEPPVIDLETIGPQTRALVRVAVVLAAAAGILVVWTDLVPALGIFDDYTLWQYVTGSGADAQAHTVTLLDLMTALTIGVVAGFAARNVPGLLEMTVLWRLREDTGIRFATRTIVRYCLVVAALIVPLSYLGIGWRHLQWLLAALGIGLGFGLQEIFANFVSGLIILFERPIRLGDTVTVNEVTGTVTRIRIRATTITDWDQKEVIIPNKTFVTGQLINWTLSDPNTRVIIHVGIAYGSDTELAHDVILEAAHNSQWVLDDPAPVVVFSRFAEDRYIFELRVFVRDVYHIPPLTHELHTEIDKALRRHGIVIPHPQRDLHIHTVEPRALARLVPRTGLTGESSA